MEFAQSLRGKIILPKDPEYEIERKVWNGMIDKRPLMIVKCSGVSDIIKTINFAKKLGVKVCIRGGGHHIAGNSVCEGIVMDFSNMRSVRVDLERKVAIVEAGCTWRDVDMETQSFGLATPGGVISTTGVSGLTLGGGVGWLSRKFGLACDNVISMEVVTQDGKLIKANSKENPDLYWALRGGGWVGLGVVTSFEFKLYDIGNLVLLNLVGFEGNRVKEILSFLDDFSLKAPKEFNALALMSTAPPLPFVPKDFVGKKMIALITVYIGDLEEGKRVMEGVNSVDGKVFQLYTPIPYSILQQSFDVANPKGLRGYWKNHFMKELREGALNTIESYFNTMPSPISEIHVQLFDGEINAKKDNAFTNRDERFVLNIVGKWVNKDEDERNVNWVKSFWNSLLPYSRGIYVNFDAEGGQHYPKSNFHPEVLEKLMEVKSKYDPNNFFEVRR